MASALQIFFDHGLSWEAVEKHWPQMAYEYAELSKRQTAQQGFQAAVPSQNTYGAQMRDTMAVMRAQVQAQTQAQAIAHAQYNSQMQGVLQAKRVESLARAKSYFEKREQVLEQFKLWVARPQQRAVRRGCTRPKSGIALN